MECASTIWPCSSCRNAGLEAVQHARLAVGHGRAAGGLDADQPGGRVHEAGERAGRVGAAAHAGHHDVRRGAGQQVGALPARLLADDPLKLADHPRVRMRAHDRADAVVRRVRGRHPVPHGLVDGVLERARAGADRHHGGPEQLHPEHVELLAGDVDLAHVDGAVQAEVRGGGRRGHPVLPGARLRDQRRHAHPPGQQGLAQRVIDLVAAGVGEVLALEQHPHAQRLGQPRRLGHRRRPPGVVAQHGRQLGPEPGVGPGRPERLLQPQARRDQGLGDEAPAERAEPSPRPRITHQIGNAGQAGHPGLRRRARNAHHDPLFSSRVLED